MSLITWGPQLSVGINSIDEQHKKLVNMINALNDALAAGEGKEMLGKIFNGLAAYTTKHFQFEEDLFAKYNYPETAAHKKEHADLLKQVGDLKAKMDAGNFMISMELMAFLKSWLTNHIQGTDKKYVAFLTSEGVS